MSNPRPFTPTQERRLRRFIRLMSALNVKLYRLTGGRLGARFRGGARICLLTTIGRKSGKQRTIALVYLRGADGLDPDEVVLVASLGGSARHPEWYLNLRDNPEVEIQIGGQRRSYRARTAGSEERAMLWPQVVAVYKDYETYQARTQREIPLVVCTPVASGDREG